MATLAHELGGLIGPLHGSAPVYRGASTGFRTRPERVFGFALRRCLSSLWSLPGKARAVTSEERRRREAEIASGLIEAWATKSQRDAAMKWPVRLFSRSRRKNRRSRILAASAYCQARRERLNSAPLRRSETRRRLRP
jgi:hypothetical protein